MKHRRHICLQEEMPPEGHGDDLLAREWRSLALYDADASVRLTPLGDW
jgi:hypothetical protein